MEDVEIKIGELNPSVGRHEGLPNQFKWRNTGKFSGENEIFIMDTKEPIWWNRPVESKEICKLEKDGIYSYNLPFLGDRGFYKTGYNVLLGKNSITFTSLIKLSRRFDEERRQKLINYPIKMLIEVLTELGVDEKRLSTSRNDLLFDGKKFVGEEVIIKDNVYCEAFVLTLNYTKEKDIFDRLTGKYAHKRGIIGISEVYPNLTKEVLIPKIYEKVCKYIEEI